MIKRLLFILTKKKNNIKISFNTYIKCFKNIMIGDNTQIHSNVSLEACRGKLTIDKNVILNRYVYCKANKGEIFIGEGSEINTFTNIDGWGGVRIGRNVLIGPSVNIISYNHNYQLKSQTIKSQGSKKKEIIIEDDVWIGANVTILAGVKIKKGAVIGAGSVVTKDIDEYSINIGIPAKKIKERI